MEWIILIFYYSSEALAVELAVLFGCFVRRFGALGSALTCHFTFRQPSSLFDLMIRNISLSSAITHILCANGIVRLPGVSPIGFITMKTTVCAPPALVKLNASGLALWPESVLIFIWSFLFAFGCACITQRTAHNIYALETIQSSISARDDCISISTECAMP